MSNTTITNIDNGEALISGGTFEPGVLTFAAAGTVKANTILARSSATGKFVPYVVGGTTAGNGVPKAVVLRDVTATAAGDEPIRACTTGTFNLARLVVAADADASNITPAIRDELRDYGILTTSVRELNILDNQ